MSDFKYNSKYTAPIKEEYMQWLKKNHPGEYYDKFGGKKPFNRLSKVGKVGRLGKYGALAGIVYELGKEVLSLGNIPDDLEERENEKLKGLNISLIRFRSFQLHNDQIHLLNIPLIVYLILLFLIHQ